MTHRGTQPLETARLILRPFTSEDGPVMFRNWCGDPEVTKYLTWPTHPDAEISAALARDWAEKSASPDFYSWAMVLKSLGEPVGSISVVQAIDPRIQSAEVGYCMGRAWWGQSLMTEAFARVIGFLFDEVGVNRVCARHDPRNPASGAVMRKCGLRYEATLRQADWNNQGICDVAIYALTREERRRAP